MEAQYVAPEIYFVDDIRIIEFRDFVNDRNIVSLFDTLTNPWQIPSNFSLYANQYGTGNC